MFCLIPQGAFTSKKSKIRASISSITLIVMQGPCAETLVIFMKSGGAERRVRGSASKAVKCKAPVRWEKPTPTSRLL